MISTESAIRAELESYKGRKGILKLNEKGGDISVRVTVREARYVYGRNVDLLVEPMFGIGQAWVRYRDNENPDYVSRISLEE